MELCNNKAFTLTSFSLTHTHTYTDASILQYCEAALITDRLIAAVLNEIKLGSRCRNR